MRVAMNRAKTFQTLTQTARSLLTLLGANIDTVNLLKRMCVLFIKCFDALPAHTESKTPCGITDLVNLLSFLQVQLFVSIIVHFSFHAGQVFFNIAKSAAQK